LRVEYKNSVTTGLKEETLQNIIDTI
jgi:hypothetical protein